MFSVVGVIVQELTQAWQSVGLQFVIEKRATEGQASRMMTLGEKTLCVSFELHMEQAQGVLNLCLPAVVLNAILRRLIAEGDRPQRRSSDTAMRMRQLMSSAKAELTLRLPSMRLRASLMSSRLTCAANQGVFSFFRMLLTSMPS